MTDVLRLLAIHVVEPVPRGFEWVITERANDEWKEIDRAEDLFDSYQTAMARGLVALKDMICDLDMGPRRDLEQSDPQLAAPAGTAPPPPSHQGTAGAREVKPRASYFGFGPIR